MTKTTDGLKTGDYFVSSWGYDQTNITFFRVVGVTAQSVRVQEVSNRIVGHQGINDLVEPSDTPIRRYNWETDQPEDAPVKTKRIRRYGDRYVFTWTDYADAYLWKGGAVGQTDPRFGR
jgi:hypothetical protein